MLVLSMISELVYTFIDDLRSRICLNAIRISALPGLFIAVGE